jgi:hypothetical protein
MKGKGTFSNGTTENFYPGLVEEKEFLKPPDRNGQTPVN